MNNPQLNSDKDVQKLFEELQAMAIKNNPDLIKRIKVFNDNHIALESYRTYVNILNQTPTLTTSNFVS